MASRELIGREEECLLLNELIRDKKNILIVGDEGVGKTAVLDSMLASGVVQHVLYSQHSATLKETLVNIIKGTHPSKEWHKKNIQSLKKICYQLLGESPEYVVLDHIAWVEPKFYGFLTYLKERSIPFVIVTRRPDKKNIGHLWMSLYDYQTLEVKNLDQTKTSQLIDDYASGLDLKIDAVSDFKKDVFKLSQGNPKIIRELCRLAQEEKYRSKGYVDVKLMDLDRRIESAIGRVGNEAFWEEELGGGKVPRHAPG